MIKQYCVKKSLEIAKQLFPHDYAKSGKYRTYHYAFGFIGKKLVGIGLNQPNIPNAKALYFGKRFNVEQFKKYPYLHSEIALISKLIKKEVQLSLVDIICVRLAIEGKNVVLRQTKPCKNCQIIIKAFDIDCYYFDKDLKFLKL
jgi:hypothetical protein